MTVITCLIIGFGCLCNQGESLDVYFFLPGATSDRVHVHSQYTHTVQVMFMVGTSRWFWFKGHALNEVMNWVKFKSGFPNDFRLVQSTGYDGGCG